MKKESTIITAGSAYTDIDVLACALGYAQCLSLQEKNVATILRAPFNETISTSVKKWDYAINTNPPSDPKRHDYILVDVSDPKYFEEFVVLDHVIEVLDHHFGFEEFWMEKLGEKGRVEKVGSCATLVWEAFKRASIENAIDSLEANLLYTAIFANTLNLKAKVTSERDVCALNELERYTNLPKEWISQYYHEVSNAIFSNPLKAIRKDMKQLGIRGETICIGQLEVWDTHNLLESKELIELCSQGWHLLLLSDIKAGNTYFMTNNSVVQDWIKEDIGVEFAESFVAKANQLWMRKEVIGKLT